MPEFQVVVVNPRLGLHTGTETKVSQLTKVVVVRSGSVEEAVAEIRPRAVQYGYEVLAGVEKGVVTPEHVGATQTVEEAFPVDRALVSTGSFAVPDDAEVLTAYDPKDPNRDCEDWAQPFKELRGDGMTVSLKRLGRTHAAPGCGFDRRRFAEESYVADMGTADSVVLTVRRDPGTVAVRAWSAGDDPNSAVWFHNAGQSTTPGAAVLLAAVKQARGLDPELTADAGPRP